MGLVMDFRALFLGRKCNDKECYTKSVIFNIFVIVYGLLSGLMILFFVIYLKQGYLCFNFDQALKESIVSAFLN